jgi:ubiquinone/menaquinone biosynthesis C-methylase UbiE
MKARDVPILETLTFVNANTPLSGLRILEVGCGTGELAAQLQNQGHTVVAIDSSADAVTHARELGVDARVVSFSDFEDTSFDCLLFTRSLHHIASLREALKKAASLLNSSGLLLVEDFSFDEVTPRVAQWCYSLLGLLDTSGLLQEAEDTFGRRLLNSRGSFALWKEHHGSIHSSLAMAQAISEFFEKRETNQVPYFYRYVAQMISNNEEGGTIVQQALELERSSGALNEQLLIGRRHVARHRFREN